MDSKHTLSVLVFAAAMAGFAQTVPEFEVASVKLAPPRTGRAALFSMDSDPAMVRYSNINLRNLIAMAYRVDATLVQRGPGWLDSELYDVAAKLPPGTPRDRVPQMLQSLLARRFRLAVHRESKDQRVYFLVVGKGGPRLKRVEGGEEGDAQSFRGERLPMQVSHGLIVGHSIPVKAFAGAVGYVMKERVVDHTDLKGNFDFELRWTSEEKGGAGPELVAALKHQLGLNLEPGRAPVETIIVDWAERVPTEN